MVDTRLTSINQNMGKLAVLLILFSAVILLIGNFVGGTWILIGSWGFTVGMSILLVLFFLFGIDAYLQSKREEEMEETTM